MQELGEEKEIDVKIDPSVHKEEPKEPTVLEVNPPFSSRLEEKKRLKKRVRYWNYSTNLR